MKLIKLSVCVLSIGFFVSMKAPKKPITELKDLQKKMKAGYSYVPSGITIMDGDTVSVQGFFMMKTEVSNFYYREFLSHLKTNGTASEYQAALPDTNQWKSAPRRADKFAQYYFRHPAYQDYPVVNISYEQAEKYCDWLNMIWQKNTLNQNIKFRLPSKAEFLRAANGTNIERPYAWKSPYLRDENGLYQCNFLTIGSGSISRDEETGKLIVVDSRSYPVFSPDSDYADFMSPIKSYHPNEFEIYNLNGNVSEMIAEKGTAVGGDWYSPGYDIRNQSSKKFNGADPTVGFRPVMTYIEPK